jgi:lysophospholipase L1-like esterase
VGKVGISYSSVWKEGQYYKFPPNYILKGARGQSSEIASINSLGFRGPDFQAIKPTGTLRIICLGGSSTFGFHNQDTGTYPVQLQNLLNQNHRNITVEVINAGFPYYTTGSILSLLQEEILNYGPDILTLYSAANDTGWPLKTGGINSTITWLKEHSIVFFLIDYFIYRVQTSKIFRRIIPQSIDHDEFNDNLAQISMRYRKNVKMIVTIAKRNSIPIILIKQPMTSDKKYISYTYEEEYNEIMDKFQKNQPVTIKESLLIKHYYLTKELERIAIEEDLPMVDNIAIADRDRSRLASWVHLTEEANLLLSQSLKLVIESLIIQKASTQWFDGL